MNGPSDAAVEAAAKAMYDLDWNLTRISWADDVHPNVRDRIRNEVRAALSAALSIIREELAAEIVSECGVYQDGGKADVSYANAYAHGRNDAARIVRGGEGA